jgi:hypothetical protein
MPANSPRLLSQLRSCRSRLRGLLTPAQTSHLLLHTYVTPQCTTAYILRHHTSSLSAAHVGSRPADRALALYGSRRRRSFPGANSDREHDVSQQKFWADAAGPSVTRRRVGLAHARHLSVWGNAHRARVFELSQSFCYYDTRIGGKRCMLERRRKKAT